MQAHDEVIFKHKKCGNFRLFYLLSVTDNASVSLSNMSTTASVYSPTGSNAKEDIVGKPNTALLSLVWCLGTFYLATTFKAFKNSHYLGKTVSILKHIMN